MSDELNESQVENKTEAPVEAASPSMDELIEKAVEERLAKIKGSLDNAYSQRDNALKEAEELKKAKQEAEIKSLEDQGKATEALEARLKQQEEAMSKLMEQNTALSRDTVVREQLAALEFSGEKAAKMAANDLTGLLKRDDQGQWVGQNGESISEVVQSYAQDEANAFLFRAKISQGSQSVPSGNTAPANPANQTKSISEMSVEEALAAAERGDFDGAKKWY